MSENVTVKKRRLIIKYGIVFIYYVSKLFEMALLSVMQLSSAHLQSHNFQYTSWPRKSKLCYYCNNTLSATNQL